MYPDRVAYTNANPTLIALEIVPTVPDATVREPLPDDASQADKDARAAEEEKERDLIAAATKARDNAITNNNKINTASSIVQRYLNRLLPKQELTCTWHISSHGACILQLPVYPLPSTLTITDADGVVLEHTITDPNIVKLNRAVYNGTLTCAYEGGYEDIPDDIINATRQVMSALTEGDGNIESLIKASGALEQVVDMPPKVISFMVKQQLNPYMRMVI